MTVFAQKWRGRVFSAVLVALVALALFSRVDAQSRVDKLKIAIKLVQDKIDLLKFEEAIDKVDIKKRITDGIKGILQDPARILPG
mmetsp:Transcript_2550/g.5960  ORF Transcript_2550/g.5960 Transcript_2550/m.5960 type:complete len:85 (+) Transcript_2550:112-366(+)